MKVVIDTNIIFSALLREDNRYANAIIKNEEAYDFYAVYFTIVELFKHKEKIQKFSKLSEEDILEILYELLKHIHIINDDIISITSWKQAMQLAHDVDIKDVPNVALTIELSAQLWTNDNELKKGLRAKGFNEFLEFP
jgi:predicted nucleic acid-binding protein